MGNSCLWCILEQFILFVYSYLCYVRLSNCPFFMDDQKVKSSLYAFIMNHKLLLYLYFFSLDDGLIADLKNR